MADHCELLRVWWECAYPLGDVTHHFSIREKQNILSIFWTQITEKIFNLRCTYLHDKLHFDAICYAGLIFYITSL